MKLVTIDAREVAGRPGVLLDNDQVLDLSAASGTLETSQWVPQSTISILAAGERGLAHAQAIVNLADEDGAQVRERGGLTSLLGTPLMTPVRRPGLILVSHSINDGVPASFIKSPNTAVGHAAKVSMQGQPELEVNPMFAAVLSKPLYQADLNAVETAIGAWTLVIDIAPLMGDPGSAQEWRSYVQARQFPGSMPMGPALVTFDELASPGELIASARINGVQTWSGIICPPASECSRRLAELSQDYAFSPGDVVAFATGVDSVSSPRQRLKQGDAYSIAADGIMELAFQLTA